MKPLAAHGPQRDHPIAPPPPTDRRTADKLHLRVGLGFPSRGVLLDRPLLLTPGIGNSVASACSPYTRRGFSSAFLLSSMPGGRRGVSGCPPPAPAPPRTPPARPAERTGHDVHRLVGGAAVQDAGGAAGRRQLLVQLVKPEHDVEAHHRLPCACGQRAREPSPPPPARVPPGPDGRPTWRALDDCELLLQSLPHGRVLAGVQLAVAPGQVEGLELQEPAGGP